MTQGSIERGSASLRPFPRAARRWTLAVLAAILFASPQLAAAQDLGAMSDTLGRLERQLQTLERTVYRGDPPPPHSAQSYSLIGDSDALIDPPLRSGS